MSAQIVLGLRLLVSILLYAFLFLFLYISWRSIFSAKKDIHAAEHKALRLKNTITNEVNTFHVSEIYIGRGGDANLQVMDDSISNLHTRLYLKEMDWWIEDLDSTNGTFINKERIISPEMVSSGDLLNCGATEFEILLNYTNADQKNNFFKKVQSNGEKDA